MPVPIKPIEDRERRDYKQTIDYSFLATLTPQPAKTSKTVVASNKDASLLYELWSMAEKGNKEGTYKIDSSINSKDIMRLKTRGFLTGNSEEVKFTKKGRMIVTTMALSEPNNFAKEKKQKKYTEILAYNDKRGKKGYRLPKYATDNSNNLRLG